MIKSQDIKREDLNAFFPPPLRQEKKKKKEIFFEPLKRCLGNKLQFAASETSVICFHAIIAKIVMMPPSYNLPLRSCVCLSSGCRLSLSLERGCMTLWGYINKTNARPKTGTSGLSMQAVITIPLPRAWLRISKHASPSEMGRTASPTACQAWRTDRPWLRGSKRACAGTLTRSKGKAGELQKGCRTRLLTHVILVLYLHR